MCYFLLFSWFSFLYRQCSIDAEKVVSFIMSENFERITSIEETGSQEHSSFFIHIHMNSVVALRNQKQFFLQVWTICFLMDKYVLGLTFFTLHIFSVKLKASFKIGPRTKCWQGLSNT